MIKKRIIMNEDREETEHEEKKLNPNLHRKPEIKDKKLLKNAKSSTIQFYIIVILIFFILYRFFFPPIQKAPEDEKSQDKFENNSSK